MNKISSLLSISFLILLLLVIPVMGSSNWVEYSRNSEGNILLYQKVNIQKDKNNDMDKIWVKRVFSDVGRKKYVKLTKDKGIWTEGLDKISHIVGLYEIDCKKRMTRQLSVVIYDMDGKNIGSLSNGEPKWSSIVSGSEMDSLRKKFCQ
jgi:hypothetical protein